MIKYVFVSSIFFVCLLTLNTYMLFCAAYFFPQLVTQTSSSQIQHQNIVKYILIDQKTELQALTREESSHIKDVRNIVQALPILAVCLISLLFYIHKKHHLNWLTTSKYAITVLLTALPIITFLFMPFFILFHQVLFPQGNWEFSTDSILIQLYPITLWQNSTIALFLLTVIELLIVRILNTQKMVHDKNHHKMI